MLRISAQARSFPTDRSRRQRYPVVEMKFTCLLLSVLLLQFRAGESEYVDPEDPEDTGPDAPQVTAPPSQQQTLQEVALETRIRSILEHFKQDNPRGMPGVPIPDPMTIPDFEGQFSVGKIQFSEAELHGLSQFKIEYIRTDLTDLKVWVELSFESLQVLGRYRMSSWLGRSSGNFNVTLVEVRAEGYGKLEVNSEGSLQASNITLDVRFKDIAMNFDNLGFFGSLFQGIINSVGTFIFDSIKPLILSQVNDNIQSVLNTQMRSLNQELPDSVPVVDLMLAQARLQMKEMDLDPFELPDFSYDLSSGIRLKLTNGTLAGLSTIHRSGDLALNYVNGSVALSVQAATQRLTAAYKWHVDFRLYTYTGKLKAQIDYLDVKIGLRQPVNIEKKPRLEVLKVRLGNIQVRSEGAGTFDYIIEVFINFIVNGLRSLILEAVEKPVTDLIQEQLDTLDIAAIVEENLPNLSIKTEFQ